MRFIAVASTSLSLALVVAPASPASPVAVDDASYTALGRVFPDPLGGCTRIPSAPLCSPNAKGNVPAAQFIQFEEFLAGIAYLNLRFPRYMEVWPLDGRLDELPARHANGTPADLLQAAPVDPLAGTPADVRPRAGTGLGADAFPGNDLGRLEFTPRPEYRSAGLPTTTLGRRKSDLMVVRVTDESVPDAGKKRYALALSIHGIERAGLEGGTRAVEDLVSAELTGLAGQPVVPAAAKPGAPTFAEALDKSIIYFTYPNPDGWRRGSYSEGGLFFQRYNGNGVDLNRDWPDIGFSFRPYSGLSEPESRALAAFFTEVRDRHGAFAAGDDLHGQPFADALSYTLLPHGRHDYAKDVRIRETSKTIHRASYDALKWSPLIIPPDQPPQTCANTQALGTACRGMHGQTWGTVYDTINYTTTGALGDWFDSTVGLNADGIDNEMSFSHLDRNIVFDPHTEQLHVDGNKSLIYAHLAEILAPTPVPFDARGTKGYVPNTRLVRAPREAPAALPGTRAQDDIRNQPCVVDPTTQGRVSCSIAVQAGNGIHNGGMRVDITTPNAGGIGSGINSLKVQCQGCDQHRGTTYADIGTNNTPADLDGQWITVQEDYNQAGVYAQAGLTASVNGPQAVRADGTPVKWRALLETRVTYPVRTAAAAPATPAATMDVDFTSGPASIDGGTAAVEEQPPALAGYDVANTDFFADLNRHITGKRDKIQAIDPATVISGEKSLDDLDTLALADDPLPGSYTAEERAEWFRLLREWVQRGGNLVLTDGALTALRELTTIQPHLINPSTVYVGQVAFSTSTDANTLDNPATQHLTQGVAQQGARFNSQMRRQTFEPTPLGFAIQDAAGSDASFARQFSVQRTAWEAAGGTTAASSASAAARTATGDGTRTTVGELRMGAGQIRIAGALLPQPATWPSVLKPPPPGFLPDLAVPPAIARTFPLGLEPYAVTYTGYILARNLLHDSTPADHNVPPVAAIGHAPEPALTGETVSFDASGSTDPDGEVVRYEWDLDGDGVFETDTAGAPATSRSFGDDGVHDVAVKVTDDEGKSSLAVTSVTVRNRPPTAAFAQSPDPAKHNKPVTFDAGGSTDPDGDVVRHEWDLDGDGTFETDTGVAATVTRTYKKESDGITIRLRVADDDGAVETTGRTLRVRPGGGDRPLDVLRPRGDAGPGACLRL